MYQNLTFGLLFAGGDSTDKASAKGVSLEASCFYSSIEKEPHMEQQLPNPFPLPQNYPVDVETDLKRGSMTVTTMRKFVTVVAHAIFALKRYPSLVEFTLVALQIVNNYPFLKNTGANPHV